MTNPLKNNYLLRGAGCLAGVAALFACGHPRAATPEPTAALPTATLAAQQVCVLPLTLVAAEESLRWEAALGDRRATLARADSVLGALLAARAPEVSWVLPGELRRAARRAPGIAPDPDQLGTALLYRAARLEVVPDPLRSELWTLVSLAGSGGRYALIPAALVFHRLGGPAAAPGPSPAAGGVGTAELTVVVVDVRTGRIGFRTVARGEGDDPWTALTRAVKRLTPGLP